MIPEDAMTTLADGLKSIKEQLWYEAQIREVSPKLTMIGANGPVTVPDTILDGLASTGQGITYIMCRVKAAVDSHWSPDYGLDAVVLGVEALGRKSDGWVECEYEKGCLAKDQSVNPASDVFNVLTVMVSTSDLVGGSDVQTASRVYRYGDGGVIEWEELVITSDVDGSLSEAMQSFFQKENA
jgi:hypothetical protein